MLVSREVTGTERFEAEAVDSVVDAIVGRAVVGVASVELARLWVVVLGVSEGVVREGRALVDDGLVDSVREGRSVGVEGVSVGLGDPVVLGPVVLGLVDGVVVVGAVVLVSVGLGVPVPEDVGLVLEGAGVALLGFSVGVVGAVVEEEALGLPVVVAPEAVADGVSVGVGSVGVGGAVLGGAVLGGSWLGVPLGVAEGFFCGSGSGVRSVLCAPVSAAETWAEGGADMAVCPVPSVSAVATGAATAGDAAEISIAARAPNAAVERRMLSPSEVIASWRVPCRLLTFHSRVRVRARGRKRLWTMPRRPADARPGPARGRSHPRASGVLAL